MLLQKTGWRIKHLISTKKNSTLENSDALFDNSQFSKTKLLPSSAPKRLSWLSQTSLSDSPPFRRSNSNVTTRSHRLAQSSSTGHSSATSLCSCECEANPAPIEHALFGVESPPPLPEILYLPPTTSEHASSDAKAWQLIFQEPSFRPLSLAELWMGTTIALTSELRTGSVSDDTAEAILPSLVDEDKTPTQSLRYTGESDMEDVSEYVEQLIRETDQAFKAVGNALADAKAATQGWPGPSRSAPLRPESVTRGISNRGHRAPLRSTSVSKNKKKRPAKTKSNISSRTTSKVPPPPANTPTRWTLTDVTTNMAEVFSGKKFRTEVDEMLTPERIQQIKKDKAETERKISAESSRTFETDCSTPTVPFGLESLTSRITASDQDPQLFSTPVPSQPASPQVTPRAPTKIPPPRPARPNESPNQTSAGTLFGNFSFPAPPIPSRAARRSSASRTASLLPTIPEITPLNLTLAQSSNYDSSPNSSRPPLMISPPPPHIFLPSTSFTITSPLFCHGPIRLDCIIRDGNGVSPEEEALDWIAFQMAIAGTIELDQYFGHDQRDDAQWESDEAEIDGLIEWWKSLGLGGYGRMENEDDVREKDGIAFLPKAVSVTAINKQPTDRKVLGRWDSEPGDSSCPQTRTWRTWTNIPPPPIPPTRNYNTPPYMANWRPHAELIDTSKIPLNPSATPHHPPQISSLTIPPEPPRRPSVAESLLSLPPSPMLDLVVSNQAGKDGEVPIPMGFNLGHDLGDFLSWEARHVQCMFSEK